MSNFSGASTGSSVGCPRGRVYGVPKTCSCGEKVVELVSKSSNNPYRRYYRCVYAVVGKLVNDNHTFKWVDEAHLDEIEALKMRNARLEEKLEAITIERMEFERIVLEKVKMQIEEASVQSSHTTKMMTSGAIVFCMVMVCFSKLFS